MRPVSATATIDAPRARVCEFLSDLANRPSITDHFLSEFRLERLQSAGIGAAARFLVTAPKLWMETVLAEVDAPHRIFERGRAGRADRVPVFTVWELVGGPGPDSCEVTVTFWTEPTHPIDGIRERRRSGRWYRRQWARTLARLKDVLEGGQGVERVGVGGGDRLSGVA